jgi:radical SAM enzyme (TIGR01210 family)
MSAALTSIYPQSGAERDRWILERRPRRNLVDPSLPYAFFVEKECSHTGEIVPVATILLTNRECPWRCLMCDLWKNTLTGSVPAGAIPGQIDYALSRLPPARQVKLYNSGSFFDPRAIPVSDHTRIAAQVSGFDRVVVESHPMLVGDVCFRFNDLVAGKLEVAMGLETANPEILERLNKRMTLQDFAAAAGRLNSNAIDLRVFILVRPPFMREDEALHWARKSLDFAFDCGATAATLIPTRAGNGAIEELAAHGDFAPPQLTTLEAAMAYGVQLQRGRVFTDLWETSQVRGCPHCRDRQVERLARMNLLQKVEGPVTCESCGDTLG